MRAFGAIFAALTLALSASAAAIFPRNNAKSDAMAGLAAGSVAAALDHTVPVSAFNQDVHKRQVGGGNPLAGLGDLFGGSTGDSTGDSSDQGNSTPSKRNEKSYPELIEIATEAILDICADISEYHFF